MIPGLPSEPPPGTPGGPGYIPPGMPGSPEFIPPGVPGSPQYIPPGMPGSPEYRPLRRRMGGPGPGGGRAPSGCALRVVAGFAILFIVFVGVVVWIIFAGSNVIGAR
jgi:hypothetical protein